MIDSPKNTHINLSNLGKLLKQKMTLIKHENEQIKNLKEEIRGILIENDIVSPKTFENKEIPLILKVVRSFSFDIGMFKMEEKELSKEFIKEETTTVTTTKDVFDKKGLEKLKPEVYKKYLCENTPRLSVK